MKNYKELITLTYEKKKLAVASLILIVGGLYFILNSSQNAEPILKVVEVITAKPQNIEQTVRLIGTIRAKYSTMLTAKVTGVLEILKQSGETVTKDTLIAHIRNPDIEKRYEFALSSVHIAKEQYERAITLMKKGATSKQAVEEKQSAFLEAEKNLATAKIELDKIKFYAPFNGTIGIYKERDGTEIKSGTVLLSFYDPTLLIVEVDIPAPLLASVNIGQKVVIDGKRYRLTQIQKMLDEATHMAPAVIDIAGVGHIIGAPIDVELTVCEKNNVIVLPDETVFLEQGKPHVYVIKDSKTVLTPVKLGLRAREKVEITKGVKSGDRLVSQGQGRLSHDLMIKVHNPKLEKVTHKRKQLKRDNKDEINRIFR